MSHTLTFIGMTEVTMTYDLHYGDNERGAYVDIEIVSLKDGDTMLSPIPAWMFPMLRAEIAEYEDFTGQQIAWGPM